MTPMSPPSLCTNRCGTLVYGGGQCPDCLTVTRRTNDRQRPNGYQRGWTQAWSSFSKRYLWEHPTCVSAACSQLPEWNRTPSTDVDHTDGHSRTCAHKYDTTHMQALCHPCHARKTVAEDGGFTGGTQRCTTTNIDDDDDLPDEW